MHRCPLKNKLIFFSMNIDGQVCIECGEGDKMTDIIKSALSVFPERLKIPVGEAVEKISLIQEIRLVARKNVYLYTGRGIFFIDTYGNISQHPPCNALMPSPSELDEISDRAIGYSGFSRERELKNSYITYGRGCRMGLCCDGNNAFSSGKITSLNIRIPHFPDSGISTELSEIMNFSTGLLVAGAPSSGKTTLLRKMAQYLSSGQRGQYRKICIIDERNEITAGNPFGICTDVIRGKPKDEAILHAIRLLSPHYIICDEIGSERETYSLLEGLNAGASFIASVHAGNISSLIRRRQFRILFDENVFDKVLVLSAETPGKIESVYSYEELYGEICRSYGNFLVGSADRDISFIR